MPERLVADPDGAWLDVALLGQEHSSYWWEEDQYGYIAKFDMLSRSKEGAFPIEIDPYDLVATDDGHLYVSSGSGQWTYFDAHDTTSWARTGRFSWPFRQASRLALHPTQLYVYAADTDSSPSDIRRFSVSGAIVSDWDSIYHGDHRMDGNVYISADGSYLLTRGGDLYTCAPSRESDMRYIGGLSVGKVYGAAWDAPRGLMYTVEADGIHCYNSATFARMGVIAVPSREPCAIQVDSEGTIHYAFGDAAGDTQLRMIANPGSRIGN